MLMTLLWSLLISLGINGLLFLLTYRFQSNKLTDTSYALSFLTLAVYGFIQSPQNAYAVIILTLVTLWALRIGVFLLNRVIKAGEDSRFDAMRENFQKFGKFWLAQAVVVWILMIPAMLAFQHEEVIQSIAVIGLIIWLIGFVTETIADAQKYQFTKNNKNRWIENGIWKYSRHPNYFGEILVRLGVYLFVVPRLPLPQAIVSLTSPVFIAVLLIFISGIPILEKSADKRWGSQKGYQDYKLCTSILIPLPPKS